MQPDAPPRQLKEKTEKHYCVKCLSEVPRDEYLENDFLCDECAEEERQADAARMKDE